GLVVDTAHFKGNFPQACSVEACEAPGQANPETLMGGATRWTEILARSGLGAPDWPRLLRAGGEADLACVENGGLVLLASDMFFGSRHNLILPGRGRGMSD